MKKLSLFGLGAGLIAALSFTPELAIADGHKMSTLETVKKRGHLRCQVSSQDGGVDLHGDLAQGTCRLWK